MLDQTVSSLTKLANNKISVHNKYVSTEKIGLLN